MWTTGTTSAGLIPYSSRFFSDRQTAYTDNFKLKSAYTPQMVVDTGSAEFVGNNPNLASRALQKALAQKKIPVRITDISLDTPHVLRAHVEADALPDTSERFEKPRYILSSP